MEKKITDCDILKGKRHCFIYATFEGGEYRVIGVLPLTGEDGNTDIFIGLTYSQARKRIASINAFFSR